MNSRFEERILLAPSFTDPVWQSTPVDEVFRVHSYRLTRPKWKNWVYSKIINWLKKERVLTQYEVKVKVTDSKMSYRRISIDKDRVLHQILEAGDRVLYELGKRPKFIIVGGSEYDNLQVAALKLGYDRPYLEDRLSVQKMIKGMMDAEIILLPWYEGVLVVPEYE